LLKKLQLKPDVLWNDLFFSKDKFNLTAWRMAAECGRVVILEKMWDFAKNLS
jgi:hypothetical protein